MAVRIGHASTPNPSSGLAADQVKISNYYNGSWYVVLRPRTLELAAKSAAICEASCNKNTAGSMVLYSQNYRNTLKQRALEKAGYSASDESKLCKVTPSIISAISTTCYADCSSFMTFCACCGGAKFGYDYWGGGNAPTCSKMLGKFTNNGAADSDYVALTATKYTSSSNYLQRGDILVSQTHTVMVLDNGSMSPTFDYSSVTFDGITDLITGTVNTAYIDITTLKVNATITRVTETSMSVLLKITKIEDGVEKALTKTDELASYTWTYKLEPLDDSSIKKQSSNLKVAQATTTHTISNLIPNKTYIFSISASKTQEKIKLQSANIIFTTLQSYPTAVKNLSVTLEQTENLPKKFNISFNAPASWGNANLQKCYRLVLAVNGKIIAYNDSIIQAPGACNKSINLSRSDSKADLFSYNDSIQIGVLPGLKDSNNNFSYDINSLVCVAPKYVKNYMTLIDKQYLKINNTFKRVIVYNNKIKR